MDGNNKSAPASSNTCLSSGPVLTATVNMLFFIVPLGTIYGQNQLITIAGKNITLLKAFDAIESQTQLSITYSRTKIDVNRTLSVDFKKQKLSIVLDKLLAGTGFTYKIEKGTKKRLYGKFSEERNIQFLRQY